MLNKMFSSILANFFLLLIIGGFSTTVLINCTAAKNGLTELKEIASPELIYNEVGESSGSDDKDGSTPSSGEGSTPDSDGNTTPSSGEGEGSTPDSDGNTTPSSGDGEGSTPDSDGNTTPSSGDGEGSTPDSDETSTPSSGSDDKDGTTPTTGNGSTSNSNGNSTPSSDDDDKNGSTPNSNATPTPSPNNKKNKKCTFRLYCYIKNKILNFRCWITRAILRIKFLNFLTNGRIYSWYVNKCPYN
ncbi:uncharacterized protein LOC127288833 isoform X8 [Leptopilina boulardi]|uniref:uncharacterized protein LOC127288833 isoform X8 n=1 Tax=Leptopilina boulardi TaxID=63433 RepID=UPI0021F650DB|nr:uncharacterized protein LOC127288833 isoform X8 [Leptopilina boulardi]